MGTTVVYSSLPEAQSTCREARAQVEDSTNMAAMFPETQ